MLATGTYAILAFGAQGGDGNLNDHTGAVGGKGAKVQGDFELTAGEVLQIVVGGSGRKATPTPAEGAGAALSLAPSAHLSWSQAVAAARAAGVTKDGPSEKSGYGGKTSKDGGDGLGSFVSRGVGGSGGSGGSGGGYYGGGGGGGGFAGAGERRNGRSAADTGAVSVGLGGGTGILWRGRRRIWWWWRRRRR